MPSFRTGNVVRVVESHADLQRLEVEVDGELREAILYPRYAAPASEGDRVVLNTTAVELALGTGGVDFVVWNLAADSYDAPSGGHVMKLRYTPAQADVDPALGDASLDGTPVVAISVHSQLLPVVSSLRARAPRGRIAFVMTDGGALEIAFSRTVRRMRELGWLSSTVTCGHAIGGDIEAVNLYSALVAARDADVIVAGIGPGVVGTGTWLGHTGLDQGLIVNATGTLGGRPIVALRMSQADPRERHRGVDAHASSALAIALLPADVPVPIGHVPEFRGRHRIVEVDCDGVLEEIAKAESLGVEARVMGRGPDEDALFFLAAGAAGYHAAMLLAK